MEKMTTIEATTELKRIGEGGEFSGSKLLEVADIVSRSLASSLPENYAGRIPCNYAIASDERGRYLIDTRWGSSRKLSTIKEALKFAKNYVNYRLAEAFEECVSKIGIGNAIVERKRIEYVAKRKEGKK